MDSQKIMKGNSNDSGQEEHDSNSRSEMDGARIISYNFSDVKAKVYAAFDVQVLYRAPIKQATIWVTITPTTPGIITALTTDPRTDHDTAYGHLTNAPMARPAAHAHGVCPRRCDSGA